MNTLFTKAYDLLRRVWESLLDNFKQIIAWTVLLVAGGAFVLLLCWAFVSPDGETIHLGVVSAGARGVFIWLVALWVSAVHALISYGYLRKHGKKP